VIFQTLAQEEIFIKFIKNAASRLNCSQQATLLSVLEFQFCMQSTVGFSNVYSDGYRGFANTCI